MFYMVAYVLTSLVSFGMILLLSRKGFEADRLDDLKGLNARSPWWAFVMLLAMFSLAGMPPTIGFYAQAAGAAGGGQGRASSGSPWSACSPRWSARSTTCASSSSCTSTSPSIARRSRRAAIPAWLLSANGLALLLFGILPQPLMGLCAVALVQSQYY